MDLESCSDLFFTGGVQTHSEFPLHWQVRVVYRDTRRFKNGTRTRTRSCLWNRQPAMGALIGPNQIHLTQDRLPVPSLVIQLRPGYRDCHESAGMSPCWHNLSGKSPRGAPGHPGPLARRRRTQCRSSSRWPSVRATGRGVRPRLVTSVLVVDHDPKFTGKLFQEFTRRGRRAASGPSPAC
jgi:hypothetical protein